MRRMKQALYLACSIASIAALYIYAAITGDDYMP
jgi:hypothetical protein